MRIRARDVQTVLDDRRAHQHVCLIANELQHHALELVLAHLAVSRPPRAPWAPASSPCRRLSRWIRLDCAAEKTWPPRSISSVTPRRTSASQNGATTVWIARRSLGGVSITDISRSPTSDMFSVRGIGVADSREHVHVPAHLLEPFLVRHAEALLLVHDKQAKIMKVHILGEQAVRADENIDSSLPRPPR